MRCMRYIEDEAEWREVLGRQFSMKSEERIRGLPSWIRNQVRHTLDLLWKFGKDDVRESYMLTIIMMVAMTSRC